MTRLGDHHFEHLDHEVLFGPRELADAFDLLIEPGDGATFELRWGCIVAQQFLRGQAKHLPQGGKHGSREADAANLVVRIGLLGKSQLVCDLLLGEVPGFPGTRDARAQGFEELFVMAVHVRSVRNEDSHEIRSPGKFRLEYTPKMSNLPT